MKKLFRAALLLAATMTVTFSCEKDPNPSGDDQEETISYEEQQRRKSAEKALAYLKDDIMSTYYYWASQVPNLSYTYETDIYDFFDDLLYKGDRWSWMLDGPSYIAEESGLVYGTYGASFTQPLDYWNDYNVFVRYVYPDSPFDKAGVKRGWVISKIDNKSVLDYWLSSEALVNKFNEILGYPSTSQSHTFTFVDEDGETHEASIVAAETLNTRPCLVKKIFTADDYPGLTEPVGYYNYLGFKADDDSNGKSMLDDITEPMAYFKENNVKTLIVDLRYNGGGDSRASDLLVSYLAPLSADGEVYVKRTHNGKLSSQDKETTVSCAKDSPMFEHLYFITGPGSASASEMTLNGLKPLADVKHVGGITYGKPNGMYVFFYPDLKAYDKGDYSGLKYVFLPICFYNANGEGQLIPDEGMTPDNIRPDDVYHDFNAKEDNIAACLYNIVNGSYPDLPAVSTKARKAYDGPKVKLPLNKEETDKNYGSYIVRPDF